MDRWKGGGWLERRDRADKENRKKRRGNGRVKEGIGKVCEKMKKKVYNQKRGKQK